MAQRQMRWQSLLSSKRLGESREPTRPLRRSPFQVDFDRIIFSFAFRRLQDKTQVVPLAENDYVRTRLTHSLETSCIGRSIGTWIGEVLCERHKLAGFHASDFGAIVAAACLGHDIGNPPFGHSGEEAIRHWFTSSDVAASVRRDLTQAQSKDLELFEGNAQGLRLLTRLEMPENSGGMRLTYATLAAFTKYPRPSTAPVIPNRASAKKFNFFQSEKEIFREIAENVELLPQERGEDCWCRHPLAFVVEAADDITYRVIDLEDGYRLGLISLKRAEELLLAIARERVNRKKSDAMSEATRIEYMRARVFGRLVREVAEKFLKNEEGYLSGHHDVPLLSEIPSREILLEIDQELRQKLYPDRRVLEIEAAGFEVSRGILDDFVRSACDRPERGRKPSLRSVKFLKLLPREYLSDGSDTYAAVQGVLDFYSGLTDSHAVSLFKKIRGISLPGG